MSERLSGTEGYAENAPTLTTKYEQMRQEDVHKDVIHLFPPPPASVLDIGAGTGRDAAALAARGYKAVAAEPTRELREHGQRVHASAKIKWIDDGLPELDRVLDLDRRFNLVLMTAVWMHLDKEKRRLAMPGIASLIEPGGRLILSLRHGPIPEGRRMFDVSAAETVGLADEQGLRTLHNGPGADAEGRAEVKWTWLAFERPR